MSIKQLFGTLVGAAVVFSAQSFLTDFDAQAKPAQSNTVYRGPIKLPDFRGRDRSFARYRTRIVTEMKSGPNFNFHYAIIQIGCGAGCSFVYMGDVVSGQVFAFPYGGEEFYTLSLEYGVKSNIVRAQWISEDKCLNDDLEWNGRAFRSLNRRVVGNENACRL
jgi:hypothetical protein